MRNIIWIIVAIIVIVVVALLFSGMGSSNSNSNQVGSQSSNQSTQSPTGNSTSSSEANLAVTVAYTDTGFTPNVITVGPGTKVIFLNTSSKSFWVASDPHPAHTDYPGFDAKRQIHPGESYSFTFERTGTWGYHNHMNPSQRGSVTVR